MTNTSQILNAIDGSTANGFTVNNADFTEFRDLTTAGFFANDFDTKTSGVDIVGRVPVDLGAGSTTVSVAANYNNTKVTRSGNLGSQRQQALEEQLPNWKGNVMLNHTQGIWRGLVRVNYLGPWTDSGNGGTQIGGEVTVDAKVGAQVMDNVELIFGLANAFDNFPDENPGQLGIGQLYPESSPGGYNGGSYYVKARVTF